MSMMVSFVLSFFPRDVLDEILNLIESVSEDFPSYSCGPNISGNLVCTIEQLYDNATSPVQMAGPRSAIGRAPDS